MILSIILIVAAIVSFVMIAAIKYEGKELMLLSSLMLIFVLHISNILSFHGEKLTAQQESLVSVSYYLLYLPMIFGFVEMFFYKRSLTGLFMPCLLLGFAGFASLHYLVYERKLSDFPTAANTLSVIMLFCSIILAKELWVQSAKSSVFVVKLFKTVMAMLLASQIIPVSASVMPSDNFLIRYYPLISLSDVVSIVQMIMMSLLLFRLVELKRFRKTHGSQNSSGKLNDFATHS